MGTTEFIGKWRKQKATLTQKLALLTGNDRMYEKSVKEEMFAKLQVKQGKAKTVLSKITSL